MHQLYLHYYQQINKEQEEIKLDDNFNMNYGGLNQIPLILQDHQSYFTHANSTFSFLCYANIKPISDHNKTYNETIYLQQQLQSIGSIISTSFLGIDSMLYGYLEDYPNPIYSYPCAGTGRNSTNYKVQNNIWYKLSKQIYNEHKYQEYVINLTNSYQSIGIELGVNLVLPQIGIHKEYKGVWGVDLVVSKFHQFLQINTKELNQTILTAWDGRLLVHQYQVSESDNLIYFHSENITGFNLSDWEQIINPNPISNCQEDYNQFNFQNVKILCRYNRLSNQEILIAVKYSKKYDLYLISYQYFNLYNNYKQQFFDELLIELYLQVRNYGRYIIYLSISVIFVQFFIAQYILKPIANIIKKTQYLIKDGTQQEKIRFIYQNQQLQIHRGKVISDFLTAFNNLFSRFLKSKFHKNPQCIRIENQEQYSKIFRKQTINKFKLSILEKLHFLKNSNETQLNICQLLCRFKK